MDFDPGTMQTAAVAIVAALVGTLPGSGIVWLLVRYRMEDHFASKAKVEALETIVIQTREKADDNGDRIRLQQQSIDHQNERVLNELVRPLQRISERLEEMGEAIAEIRGEMRGRRGTEGL